MSCFISRAFNDTKIHEPCVSSVGMTKVVLETARIAVLQDVAHTMVRIAYHSFNLYEVQTCQDPKIT